MARKPKNKQEESLLMNDYTYMQYYNRLTELALSMFEWKNLPDTVDERFLEMCLFQDGQCVYFRDEVLGDLALQVAIGGQMNVYRIPTMRRAYAVNGYQKQLTDKDSVIIFNNYLHTNNKLDVEMFSKRLYNLDRAIDVNANAQKTPYIVQCEEGQRLTFKNLYMQVDGNEPIIYGTKGLDLNALKVLRTDAPYVADKLYTLKTQIWNEALTYLGISNTNTVKKERLISDEVMRSMGGVIASRYSRLEMRRKAADEINRMFGTNIEVNFRADYREMDDELMLTGDTEDGLPSVMVTDTRTRTKFEGESTRQGGKANE